MKVFNHKKDISTVTPKYILVTFLKSTGRYDDFLKKKDAYNGLKKSNIRFLTNISHIFEMMYGTSEGFEEYYFFLKDNFDNFNFVERLYIGEITKQKTTPN